MTEKRPRFENHFQFGRLPEDENLFVAQCGDLRRVPTTPLTEAKQAAVEIFEMAGGRPVQLALSGGLDSTCMLEAFCAAEVPFEVVIQKFRDDLNLFDIKSAIETCVQRGLPYRTFDFDVLLFFESGEFLKTASKYECQSPQLACHLAFLDQLTGVPVLGGNPIAPTWKDGKLFFVGLPGELHTTYFKYFQIQQRFGVPFFFMATPELTASFLRLPAMKAFTVARKNPDEYTYADKCRTYAEGGFQSPPRADKFTGFEAVRAYYDRKHGSTHGIAFNELFRKPLEEMFPFPREYVQFVPTSYFEAPLA